MKSQWECFLNNLGEWQGSFTKLSPQGEVLEDTPSLLVLEGLDANNKEVRLTLQRRGLPDLVLNFTTIGGGGVMFFETGAFSQGSIQFSPYSQFGAELALVGGDQRLRLVQLFSADGHLQELTLIREKRAGTDALERPPLKLEDLLGEWHGEAVTLYPDLHVETYPTKLVVQRQGASHILQQLSFGEENRSRTLSSTAEIAGSILKFNQGHQPVQVILLPDGASSNCPSQIITGHPFVLEAGWLLQPDLRQRIVRSYNSKGEWSNLTLITERKVA